MKQKFLILFLAMGLMGFFNGNLQAASIEEIMSQVTGYTNSGEISDKDLALTLGYNILYLAKLYRDSGDSASMKNYLEAFKMTVNGVSGSLITSSAASRLVGMVP